MTLAHVEVDEPGWVGVSFDLAMLADFAPTDRRLATPAERERAPELSARMLGRASDGQLELPAFPALAAQILNPMEAKNPDPGKQVDVIRQDAMISASCVCAQHHGLYETRTNPSFLPEIERELKRRVAGGGLRAGDT